jgi:hypothetical protein
MVVLRIDFHRADTMWLIEKLSLYLETMEGALRESHQLDRDRIDSYVISSSDDLDDRSEELHVHNLLFQQDFPSKVRYSFLTLAYSVLEDRTKALADELIKRGIVVGRTLKKSPDEGHMQSVRRFLPAEYGSVHVAPALWEELFDFSLIRNCIIHANGKPDDMRKPLRFQDIINKTPGLSLDQGFVNVELTYCQHVVSMMQSFFNAVFEAAEFGPAETVVESK